ncbi:HesA/MoeB/ThiF family protein [Streptomyces sp. NBC_01013]|uniref:HesA/MoeB/ThiF family protein n=1 Tax=Streptomyces sp. NBC_01013 TaxID=2903718 RepID=UPI0038666EAD|nr:ThiF family adenylyltransferase [Streptomyces sp. NBC_01013]
MTGTSITPAPLLRLRGRVQAVWAGDSLLLRLGPRARRVTPFGEEEMRHLHALRAGLTTEDVHARPWMRELHEAGLLEEVRPPSDDPDLGRFDRLLNFLSELELRGDDRYDMLARLRASHCVVVGLGGLASWTVYNLLCCGVGRLSVVDGDTVELSNLNRSILFTEGDVGRPKVDAARDSALRFSPRTTFDGHHMMIDSAGDLAPILADADLVLGVADQPPWLIKEWVALASHRAGVPFLQASGSRVGPFHRRQGDACSMCDWSGLLRERPERGEMLRRQQLLPRGDSGALSPLGSMTGGMIAMDALRHLLGITPLTADRVWEMGGDLTSVLSEVPNDPDCAVCSDTQTPLPLPSQFVRPA